MGMGHLNGDVLCSIDFETTGFIAGYHDPIEVAIVPLGADLDPMKDVLPFHTLMKIQRPQNVDPAAMRVNKIKPEDLEMHGLMPSRAAALFEAWFSRLKLAPGKKIAPLGKNWPFDRDFMREWLGPTTLQTLFYHRYRDVGPVVHFFNDRADFQCEPIPFPQTALEDIASRMQMSFVNRAHSALDDALMTARIYKQLMFQFIK